MSVDNALRERVDIISPVLAVLIIMYFVDRLLARADQLLVVSSDSHVM